MKYMQIILKASNNNILIAWYKKKYPNGKSYLDYYIARKYRNKKQLKSDMMGNYNSCILILSINDIKQLQKDKKENNNVQTKKFTKSWNTNDKIWDSFHSILHDYKHNKLYNTFNDSDGNTLFEDEKGNIRPISDLN